MTRGRGAVGYSTTEYKDWIVGGDVFQVSKQEGGVDGTTFSAALLDSSEGRRARVGVDDSARG